jgi:xanthosine utilization system XapX-like protein
LKRFLSRIVFAAAAYAAALIFVSVAVGFLGSALYLWLVSIPLAPPLAALLVGVAGLAVAALIVLTAKWILARWRTARVASGPISPTDPAGELGQLIVQEAATLVTAYPYRAFVISLIAGFAIGASPEFRGIFKSSLKE